VLSNDRRDEARALVVINAAAALFVGEKATDLKEATRLAEHSLDSGAAARKLELLVRTTSRG
jgi:anthranilate phosphoribosyltransferase